MTTIDGHANGHNGNGTSALPVPANITLPGRTPRLSRGPIVPVANRRSPPAASPSPRHGDAHGQALRLIDQGWRGLVPILPPDAQPVEGLSAEQAEAFMKGRGKAPGRYVGSGLWALLADWRNYPDDEATVEVWAPWPGVGIGMRACHAGSGVAFVDADVLHPVAAGEIGTLIAGYVGEGAVLRIGRAPKALYPIRVPATVRKARSAVVLIDGQRNMVELLGEGQQAVIHGVHPVTGQPYQWPLDDLADLTPENLPDLTADQLRELLDEASRILLRQGTPVGRNRSTLIRGDNATHRPIGDLRARNRELTLDATRFLRNDDWSRDDWVAFAYALRGAFGEEGLGLWLDFTRQSDKHHSTATAERVWADATRAETEGHLRSGAGTIMAVARDEGWTPPRAAERPAAEPAADDEPSPAAVLGELNGKYFVAMVGGRARVGTFKHDAVLGRDRLTYIPADDFRLFYGNRRVTVGRGADGRPITRAAGGWWLTHEQRRSYDDVVLDPTRRTPPGTLNLYRGFGVEPAAGDWTLIRQHLLDVICGGDERLFGYLIGWCAYCVQHPERQAEVTVVLRGLKGTGKSTVGKVLTRIFNHHAACISQSRHLTGNFNAHLEDTLFLLVEEAFWAGDKAAEGVLKSMITDETLMIERKGVDPREVPNRLKIVMASNNEWVVPATADERRYFVLDVSPHRMGDRRYFAALHREIEHGGEIAAFLHHLLAMDLSGFDIRDVPRTAALDRQVLASADSVTRFWFDCLHEGAIPGNPASDWPEFVTTNGLYEAYTAHARTLGGRPLKDKARFGERLVELNAGTTFDRVRGGRGNVGPKRPWGRRLGGLAEHRAAFERALGMAEGSVSWPADDGDDPPDGGDDDEGLVRVVPVEGATRTSVTHCDERGGPGGPSGPGISAGTASPAPGDGAPPIVGGSPAASRVTRTTGTTRTSPEISRSYAGPSNSDHSDHPDHPSDDGPCR